MPVSIWTFAFFAFVAPGFTYLQVFAAFARIRRAASSDVLVNALTFFLAALATNLIVYLLDTTLLGNTFLEQIAGALTNPPCGPDATNPEAAQNCQAALAGYVGLVFWYTVFAAIVSSTIACCVSHLIAWGHIPLGVYYYGPLYPIIRGVPRREVIATVATRLSVKVSQLNNTIQPPSRDVELPVMYRGWLDEVKLTASGRIEYISLSNPVKSLFDPPLDGHVKAPFIRIGKDEENVRLDRILVEGADIQNFYFAQLDAPLDLPLKMHAKESIAAILLYSPLLLALIALAFVPTMTWCALGAVIILSLLAASDHLGELWSALIEPE